MAALQNGAKLFVNYCLNCHSAAFMRFNRLQDIGLTEEQIKSNLLVTNSKIGDTMKSAIGGRVSQAGTLFYFGFFILMPWWSRLGTPKPVPDRVTFSAH